MTDSFGAFPGTPGAGGGGFPPQGPPGSFVATPAQGAFGAGTPAPRAQAPAPTPAPPSRGRGSAGGVKGGRQDKAPGEAKSGKKGTKPPTKRIMSRQVIIALVFALVASGVVLKVLGDTTDGQYVVRASADIAANTPVSGSLLEAAKLDKDAIEPNAFVGDSAEEALENALEELQGVVTQYPLASKSQLRADQFGLQATLGADLLPTERLVSIRASVGTAVAGGLVVGDRVDVIGATDGLTRTVAYNVPIMSITVSEERYDSVADQQSTDKDITAGELLPGNPVPGIYVVKVPADLVPSLLNWNESATLYLSYRPAQGADVVVPDNHLTDPALAPSVTAPPEAEPSGE